MRAALVEAPGQPVMLCDDVEIEEPRAGQVRVRIRHCGLCHSDLSIVDGAFPAQMPVVVGHEAAGIVDALGPHVEGLATAWIGRLTAKLPSPRASTRTPLTSQAARCGPGRPSRVTPASSTMCKAAGGSTKTRCPQSERGKRFVVMATRSAAFSQTAVDRGPVSRARAVAASADRGSAYRSWVKATILAPGCARTP